MSVPNGAPKICKNERGPMPVYIGITLGVPFSTVICLVDPKFFSERPLPERNLRNK